MATLASVCLLHGAIWKYKFLHTQKLYGRFSGEEERSWSDYLVSILQKAGELSTTLNPYKNRYLIKISGGPSSLAH